MKLLYPALGNNGGHNDSLTPLKHRPSNVPHALIISNKFSREYMMPTFLLKRPAAAQY
jgi:hypothetical protein